MPNASDNRSSLHRAEASSARRQKSYMVSFPIKSRAEPLGTGPMDKRANVSIWVPKNPATAGLSTSELERICRLSTSQQGNK